jgi:CubicO group peptidase (beta-lactamase class C family)
MKSVHTPNTSWRLAGVLCLVASGLGAQSFPPNPKVDALYAEWNKTTTPGCALGVVQSGKFIYERGYGMANLDYDIPNSPRLVYYVGSDSKQFTAASIALLVLDGKISLSDDIRKYVPEMPDYSATYGVPVTIDNLVHHTSGIRDIYTLMDLAGLRMEDVMPDSVALALIARQKELNFKPGTDYLYSNSGYWLLGQIVQRVTGKSLRVFADERIFTPLAMTHTHFHDDPGHVMKNRAMSYMPDSAHGGFRISYLQNFDKIGAGGLYTTVEDLLKWDDNFYSHKVGGDALQKLIHTRGILNGRDTIIYAFGNEVSSYRGLRTDEHGGSLMGYRAHILRFPDQHFSVIETCNLGTIDPGSIAHKVADVYLGDRLKEATVASRGAGARQQAAAPPSRLGAAELHALAGDYYSDELDALYHVAVDGDHLTLRRPLARAAPLAATDSNTFRAGSLVLHFERSGDSAPAFTVEAGRVRNIRFRRR